MTDLESLQAHLQSTNAPWTAAQTSMSELVGTDRPRRLGVVRPPDEQVASARVAAVAPAGPPPPPSFSWRDHDGVTSIKDQEDCGACVSFACCAAAESQALIDKGVTLDLSEADAHFCSSHGASCCGWWPDECLTDMAGRGVVGQSDFPYDSAQTGQTDPNCDNGWAVHCHAVSDRAAKVTVITGQATYTDTTAMKQRISSGGPVVACFDVYDDFYYYYSSGIYVQSPTATYVGGHCVEIVGYDDTTHPGCWLCKNSWGTGWGENGFFQIGYGQCGIDDQMWAVTGIAEMPAGADTLRQVFICSADGHVHDLHMAVSGGPWTQTDLNAVAGAPPAATGSALSSFSEPDWHHAYYLSADGQVHELYRDRSGGDWGHNDLTSEAAAPPAAAGSALSSYVDPSYRHVLYLSSDGHVHELYMAMSASHWSHNDLTAGAGAPPAAAGSGLSSYVEPSYRHVLYVSGDGHVHELYMATSGSHWSHNDLTAATGAPPAAAGSGLSSYVDPSYRHVLYVGNAGHVHELYMAISASHWSQNDLTSGASAPPAVAGSALSSYVDPSYRHVLYLTGDGHVHELYMGTSATHWSHSDLTAATGAPAAVVSGRALSAYADPGYRHVLYLSGDGHVHELYMGTGDSHWSHNDLTTASGAPAATAGSALASGSDAS